MRFWRESGGRGKRVLASAGLLAVLLAAFGYSGGQEFYLPLFAYMEQDRDGGAWMQDTLLYMLPVCVYGTGYTAVEAPYGKDRDQDGGGDAQILLAVSDEWEEGSDSESGADAAYGEEEAQEAVSENVVYGEEKDEEDMQKLLLQENSVYRFTVPERKTYLDWEQFSDYENLVSAFYSIDTTALAGSDLLNIESLCGTDLKLESADSEGPQILIYHTHSREAFSDSEPGDVSQTVVGVGEFLAQLLREVYGYRVMHDTTEYDTQRDTAYAKSLPELERILSENPSIRVVIDLHRDSGSAGRDMVMDIDGRRTARFMFFNGISRSKTAGDIDYLYNPNLASNLAFSFQMQVLAGEYYPGLTRKIYIKQYRYNMHLMERTLLIELGDENNTVEEAMNACYPIAFLLDLVLSGEAAPSFSGMR